MLIFQPPIAPHIRPMSSGDDKSRESSPVFQSPSRTSSRGSSRGSASRHNQGPANIIEFVDSQDPNVKSAIQRHTAYHSAAQRREARLRSLRRGSQPRILEWGRRPDSEPPTKATAGSGTSATGNLEPLARSQTASSTDEVSAPVASRLCMSAPGSRSISPRVPLSSQEEAVLRSCKSISSLASSLPLDTDTYSLEHTLRPTCESCTPGCDRGTYSNG